MKTLTEIKSILLHHKENLKKMYEIQEIAIFGSYVDNTQRKESDADILVKFEECPDLLEFVQLEMYLTRLLGVKVDLQTHDSISPYIRKYIKEKFI